MHDTINVAMSSTLNASIDDVGLSRIVHIVAEKNRYVSTSNKCTLLRVVLQQHTSRAVRAYLNAVQSRSLTPPPPPPSASFLQRTISLDAIPENAIPENAIPEMPDYYVVSED